MRFNEQISKGVCLFGGIVEDTNIIVAAIAGVVGPFVSLPLGYLLQKKSISQSFKNAESESKEVIREAREEADSIRKAATKESKDDARNRRQTFEEESKKRRADNQKLENKNVQKKLLFVLSALEKMKILHLIDHMNEGGAQKMVHFFLNNPNGNIVKAYSLKPTKSENLNLKSSNSNAPFSIRKLWDVKNYIHQFEPEIVQVHLNNATLFCFFFIFIFQIMNSVSLSDLSFKYKRFTLLGCQVLENLSFCHKLNSFM